MPQISWLDTIFRNAAGLKINQRILFNALIYTKELATQKLHLHIGLAALETEGIPFLFCDKTATHKAKWRSNKLT